jgi:hypothetical protein
MKSKRKRPRITIIPPISPVEEEALRQKVNQIWRNVPGRWTSLGDGRRRAHHGRSSAGTGA